MEWKIRVFRAVKPSQTGFLAGGVNGAAAGTLSSFKSFFVKFCFLFLLFQLLAFAEEPVFEAVEIPAKKLFVGETLVYGVNYLGIPVGEGRAEVKEKMMYEGRPVYHIIVTVKSYGAIDWVYKVRDEHHSYVDAEKFHSLFYSKKIREGRRQQEESMKYDQEAHRAVFKSGNDEKILEIKPDTQDQLSCGYFFRTLKLERNKPVFIPVQADEKNWSLEVRLHEVNPVTIEGVGKFQALEAEPLMNFQGIFFRKGKIRGWISLDKRRIPLKMTVGIPVLGRVTAELKEYIPGKDES